MTKFTNGPAVGITLQLQRSPLFLRAVRDLDGNWDALDLLDDAPKVNEDVFVYRLLENHGMVHIDGRDKQGRRFGKWLAHATYEYHGTQPSLEQGRETERWQRWAHEQAEAMKEKPA